MPPRPRRSDVWRRRAAAVRVEAGLQSDPARSRAGADSAVSSSAVMSSKARPCRSRPAWSRRAISRSSGESMIVASSTSSAGSRSPSCRPNSIELLLHPQGGLLHLGVGLCGTAEDQALVSASQAVLVVGVVEAKTDQGGSESARPRAGLLRSASSRSGPFSWDGAGIDWRASRPGPGPPARPARHAIVLSDSPRPSNSADGENTPAAGEVTGTGLTITPGIPSRPYGRRDRRP